MKQAKIQLSADIRGFSKAIDDARKKLKTLDSVKIDGGMAKALKENVIRDLNETANVVKTQMDRIEGILAKSASRMDKGFNAERTMKLVQALDSLKRKYDEVTKAAKQAASAGGGVGAGGGGQEVPVPGGGMGGGLLGKLGGKLFAAAAGVAGISASVNRRFQMAGERLDLRSVSGGADLTSERSALGFTPSERRQRAATLARAGRRDVTGEEITGLTNFSEQLSRGYGIDTGTQAGVIGAARTMGEGNAQKALMDSFAGAVRAGMEGSNIERYMQAQTGYLEEMSSHVNIDKASIDGFAAGIGDIPFFKNDPNRIFDAIRGMGEAFRNGDRFQQGQAMRAITRGAPGASVGAMELRRSMGLFANTESIRGNLKGLENQPGFKGLMSAMGVGGGDIVRSQLQEAVGATEGMDLGSRIQSIMERAGLQGEGGLAIAAKAIKGERITNKEIDTARLSPEEQIKQRINDKVYTGIEAQVKNLETLWESMKDVMASQIAEPIAKLATSIDALAAKLGVDLASAGGTGAAIAGAAGLAAGLGGGALLKAGAKGLAGVGGKLLKGAGRGVGALGRGAGAVGRGIAAGASGLAGGAAALGGGGAAGLALTTGGVAVAGGAGYLAGKGIDWGADKLTGETNQYGQTSNIFERGIAKVVPEWAGGMSAEQYRDTYSNVVDINKNRAARGIPSQGPQAMTESNDLNTSATMQNTEAVRELTNMLARGRGAGVTPQQPGFARSVGKGAMGKRK